MNFLKKKMTWGGLLGLIGICFAIIVALICRAFGVHKMIGNKLKEIKKKLW
jgi:hypothetical protein